MPGGALCGGRIGDRERDHALHIRLVVIIAFLGLVEVKLVGAQAQAEHGIRRSLTHPVGCLGQIKHHGHAGKAANPPHDRAAQRHIIGLCRRGILGRLFRGPDHHQAVEGEPGGGQNVERRTAHALELRSRGGALDEVRRLAKDYPCRFGHGEIRSGEHDKGAAR